MIVIAIANSKGGVGKTTLTSALSVRAAKDSQRVCIVDLDPQGSLASWWKARGNPTNPELFGGIDSAVEAVERASLAGYDFVFLDGPPAFLTVIDEMIRSSDVTIIPVKSGIIDLLATQDAVALARDAGAEHLCVFNDVSPMRNNKPDQLAEKARTFLFSHDVPVAKTQISHRISHIDALNRGKTAAECKDAAAAAEVEDLWQEVKALATKATKAKSKPRKTREAGNV